MTFVDLVQELHQLSRSEKLRVVQLLINDLAVEDQSINFRVDQPYEIWSPYNSSQAAAELLQMLKEDEHSGIG